MVGKPSSLTLSTKYMYITTEQGMTLLYYTQYTHRNLTPKLAIACAMGTR